MLTSVSISLYYILNIKKQQAMKHFFEDLGKLLGDALSFIRDKEARTPSDFQHPSGQPMSRKEAKKRGLLQ